MNQEDVKLLSHAIARKPLPQREKMIFQILRDLGKYIEKEDSKKPSYVV